MSATVALASSALARPVQTVLHYALCFIRDVSGVSDQHRRARWCRPYTFWSTFHIVDRLHAAAAAHKVRGTCVLIRSTVRMERTDSLTEDLRPVADPAAF